MITYNLLTQKVGGQIEYAEFADMAKSAEFFQLATSKSPKKVISELQKYLKGL